MKCGSLHAVIEIPGDFLQRDNEFLQDHEFHRGRQLLIIFQAML